MAPTAWTWLQQRQCTFVLILSFHGCQVAGAANSETAPAIAAVHAAISAVDVAAADAVHHAFTVITSHMQRVQQDQAALAQALQASQVPDCHHLQQNVPMLCTRV